MMVLPLLRRRRAWGRIAALLAAAFLAGCGRTERVSLVVLARLDPPLPPPRAPSANRSTGGDGSAPAPVVWEFDSPADIRPPSSEDPAGGWDPVSMLTDVRLSEGSLLLRSTGNDPWLVLRREISFLDHDRLEIRMRTASGTLGAVYWAPDPRGFDQTRVHTFPLKHGKRAHLYTVELGSVREGQAGAGALRLDPTDAPGDVRIESIRLLPSEGPPPTAAGPARKLALARTYRAGILFRGEYEWSFDVPPPAATRLRFVYGAISHDSDARGGMEYEIDYLPRDGGQAVVLLRDRPPPGRWRERSVDLPRAPRARGHGTIRLRAKGRSPGDLGYLARAEALGPPAAPRPSRGCNLLFLVVDTLRADRLSSYGHPEPSSPEIDRLARQGIRFDRAVAQSSWTIPSVASLLTSRYPEQIGVRWGDNLRIPAATPTLPRILADAGYATACVFGNGIIDAGWGFDRGFDSFKLASALELTADRVTSEAIGWLQHHRDERFFLYLQYIDPHDGYAPPADALASNPFVHHPGDPVPSSRIDALFTRRATLDEHGELERIRRMYDAEIRFADGEIGRLLRYLASSGLDRNTLVVLTADHGEELDDHGGWRHGLSLYQELVRVPLILRLPQGRRRAARAVETPVPILDLAPTVLDLCGVPAPPTFEGRSLRPLIEAPAPPPRSAVLFSSTRANGPPRLGVSDGRWKLIRFDREADFRNPGDPLYRFIRGRYAPEELYDLRADPGERRNLSERRPGEAARLGRLLDAHALEMERSATPVKSTIDDRTRARMRALGYIPD